MKKLWRENGLSIVLFVLFLLFLGAQSYTGMLHENDDRTQHDEAPLSYLQYLGTGSFIEATMENWESEFLQMGVYVLFTVFLFQKGSSESKPLDNDDPVNRDPRGSKNKKDAPGPVRTGGFILRIYERSLSLAFFTLFAVSFVLHGLGGAADFNEERASHGEPPIGMLGYMSTSRFWFESFQNWQSEFLAIWAMVVFSIWLRQRGSPESKPVDAPHSQTGTE